MTTSTRRPRGRPPGRQGRDLLAVARELLVGHGFRGMTMDAVAAGAGISKQSLYAAYRSKNALYAAVVRDWVDQGYDALAPHTQALGEAADVRAALRRLAGTLQAGILSPPVLQMRTLVAAEAEAFPEVAADYVSRSWDRNLERLADTLRTLDGRGLLVVDDPALAAEQFVWLAIAAPLNRLTLQGASQGSYPADRLHLIADEAVATFLDRYGPGAAGEPGASRSLP